MLGKFLLTFAVIVIALLYLQKRRVAARLENQAVTGTSNTAKQSATGTAPAAKSSTSDYRIAAYLFLTLMLGAASTMYFLRQQDANRELTVILHRDGDNSPVIYRVHKNELSQRSFTTTDGVRVTVSANERMEVVGL